MKIAITWDYELFFGNNPGTVEKCLLEPTNELLKIAELTQSKFTFFVDAGMIVYGSKQKDFERENELIQNQIKEWDSNFHETGLHIHPHWQDARYDEKWVFNVDRYKLSDFNNLEIESIFDEYYSVLKDIVNSEIISFRAGGWCIQPFKNLKNSFNKHGLIIDSSIFRGGENFNPPYSYSFKNLPNLEKWSFDDHECVFNENGLFTEIPIASKRYSPWFFWKLFILGRLNKFLHKPIGDGIPVKGGGSKKDLLTKYHKLCLSVDGYFVTEIEKTIKEEEKKGSTLLVIIGHPKACTKFSLAKLKELIIKYSDKHEFVCLRDLTK
ncbi:MAG: hypothetical protein FJZ67_05365 [Bacteroidetes bacterium]|nr:hypothetical protein [Bacteroidota bacterium]